MSVKPDPERLKADHDLERARGVLSRGLESPNFVLTSLNFPKRDETVVQYFMPDGSVFEGPKWQADLVMHKYRLQQGRDRVNKTINNIRSGLLGWFGYEIGGHIGSDIGANLGEFAFDPNHPVNSQAVVGLPQGLVRGAPSHASAKSAASQGGAKVTEKSVTDEERAIGQGSKGLAPKPSDSKSPKSVKPKQLPAPPPHELESEVDRSIRKDISRRDPRNYIVFSDKNFDNIYKTLIEERASRPELKNHPLLRNIDPSVLELSVTDLIVKRGGRLKLAYDAIYKEAETRRKRGDDKLYEEFVYYLESGRVGKKRPDNVVVGLDIVNVAMTDPTVKITFEKVIVHEFKSLFNGEATRALLNVDSSIVESYEHNPVLNIHRPARSIETIENLISNKNKNKTRIK